MFEKALPCIVELFGHTRIAGMVSEQTVGGASFVRVDVPAIGEESTFTKLYGANAIYSICPVDEGTMRAAAQSYKAAPVERWRFEHIERLGLTEGGAPISDFEDDFEDDESPDDDELAKENHPARPSRY